jgi:hypothetical protein
VARALAVAELAAICEKYDVVGVQHRLDNLLGEYGSPEAIPEELLAEIGYTRALVVAELRRRRRKMARVPDLQVQGFTRDEATTMCHLGLSRPIPRVRPRRRGTAPRARRRARSAPSRGDPDEPADAARPPGPPAHILYGRAANLARLAATYPGRRGVVGRDIAEGVERLADRRMAA